MVTILHHIGIRRFFAEITKIEETIINKDNFTDSLFEFFLEQLVNKNIFTKTSLKKLIDEESHSTKSQSLLLTRRKSIATSDPFQKNVSSLSSLIKLDLTQNKKSSIDAVKSEPLKTNKPVFKFNERLDKDLKGDLTEKSIEGSPRKTIEGGLNADLENMKNSNDLSELAVSSYSVSSDYFKDFSEDSSPNKENIKMNDLSEPSFDGLEKSESLPKEAGSNHSSRLRSLRVFKRGTSQPARRLRCEGNRRKVCKSPESGFKELLKL